MRYLRRRKAYSIRMLDRRRFLQSLAALGLLVGAPARAQVNARPRFSANPFSLGIASGYPQPGGFVLWTRLAPVPPAPGSGMAAEVIPVGWEGARDERMKQLLPSRTPFASPEWTPSLHVEGARLKP